MTDSAGALRALLADLEGPPGPRGSVTSPPTHHPDPMASPPPGRQDTPSTTAPSSATAASSPHHSPPCAPLVVGDVVSWRTSRASGYGQLLALTPAGKAEVRPFLPARSHTVHAALTDVSRLCSLSDLHALLARL